MKKNKRITAAITIAAVTAGLMLIAPLMVLLATNHSTPSSPRASARQHSTTTTQATATATGGSASSRVPAAATAAAATPTAATYSRGYSYGYYVSPVNTTPLIFPEGVVQVPLSSLYDAGKAHNITTATIDPGQSIVYFSTATPLPSSMLTPSTADGAASATGGTSSSTTSPSSKSTTKKATTSPTTPVTKLSYAALFVPSTASSLQSFLVSHGATLTVGNTPTVVAAIDSAPSWLNDILIGLLIGGLAVIVIARHNRRQDPVSDGSNQMLRSRRSPATKAKAEGAVNVPDTRFDDVAGCDEAVADLAEFVEFLKTPERFSAVGATLPKGALLCGPPGTGKTLLARAVAGEAGVPFFAASGADFTEIYVGVGPKRVRELFAKARAAGRAIIFIDEIDAIARQRSNSASGGDSERESTLIALLNEMDGFHDSEVIVLAATNRPDILDPAITRPGRLDRRVEVPLPDRRGREKILAVHSASRPLATDVDLVAMARRTSGMSGAELSQIVNEAAIEAARSSAVEVSSAHFDAAIATVAMGRARTSALVTEQDRLVTAWHEAGHTVCAYVQDAADKPVSVSIIPRGPAGGVTWMAEGDDLFLQRSKASARMVTALGGRAAEELLLGDDFTQGAYGDLTTATNLAMAMATRYGMTNLGLMVRDPNVLGSSANVGVTEVVEGLLTDALDTARNLLQEHQAFMAGLVEELLDNDTLDAADIERIYRASASSPQSSPKRLLAALTAPRPQPIDVPAPEARPEHVAARPVAAIEPEELSPLEHVANLFALLSDAGAKLRRARRDRAEQRHQRPSTSI